MANRDAASARIARFSTWTKYAPAFATPSLGQVYFNTATASIIANALAN